MVSLVIAAGLGALMVLPLQAQSQQEAVSDFDPASIMPDDTKVYLELGSPGRQFETILKLFEGTPLEDSLSALMSQQNQNGENPALIMKAVMNPAMIKEFKKIQGAAIGITQFNEEIPEFVAVLSPGQSDALRGVLIATISIAGVAGQTVEGMQLLTIKDAGTIAIAYDSNIFIIANTAEKLKETITRYKKPSGNNSLAQTAVFQKLDRNKRAANVVTVWANGKKAWRQLTDMVDKPMGQEELAVINMMADPNHIEDVLLQFSILDNDIVLDVNMTLDENHQCQAYNMIRTPHLSSEGFVAVPSDAIAMVSFALGDAEGPGVGKMQGALKQMTGLDIGREIFSNIEQITVFAVDPGKVTDIGEFPIATNGIAITSKDGQKTRDLLNTLFQTAYQGMKASGQLKDLPDQLPQGQFMIPVDNKVLVCYLEQKGNVTILSPSRQIVDLCFKAAADKKSNVTAGLLKPVLGTLPKTSSKVIAVNAGGFLRMADTAILMDRKNPYNPAHQQLKDFSRLLDSMNICIRTSEVPTRFNFNASINDIPPLGPLFPKAMALTKCDFGATGCATEPAPCNHGAITPGQAYTLEWKPGIGSTKHKVYFGANSAELKLLKELSESRIDGPSMDNGIETCYWRVDEIMPDGTVIAGDVWDFSKGTMIGYWKLDEPNDVTASDASGQNHNGSVMGDAAWRPGQGVRSGAIELDGTDDAIEINDLSFETNNATFTAWIKGQKAADWGGILFSRNWQPCGMHFGANNTLHYTWNNNSPQTYDWNGGPVIPDNTWAFVAIVISPDKTVAYVYDQNNGLKSAENPVPNIPQTVDQLKIGWDSQQDENRRFKGLVDDVRVYNYALSQDEIKALTRIEGTPTPVAGTGHN
jgi:hypothetical protein